MHRQIAQATPGTSRLCVLTDLPGIQPAGARIVEVPHRAFHQIEPWRPSGTTHPPTSCRPQYAGDRVDPALAVPMVIERRAWKQYRADVM